MKMGVSTTAQPPTTRRFTVSEYHRMAEAGILGEDDRVELLHGQIYVISPIGSQHAACVDRLARLFFTAVGTDEARVRIQNPILIDPSSELEPDVALVEPKEAYAARHPRPHEVMLLVEGSGSTLAFDRKKKLPLYAQAGIPEVWIVALDEDQIHAHRQPEEGTYAEHETCERGNVLTVQALPDVGLFDADDVLGA